MRLVYPIGDNISYDVLLALVVCAYFFPIIILFISCLTSYFFLFFYLSAHARACHGLLLIFELLLLTPGGVDVCEPGVPVRSDDWHGFGPQRPHQDRAAAGRSGAALELPAREAHHAPPRRPHGPAHSDGRGSGLTKAIGFNGG